jgi:hypothetical protein
MLYVFLIFAMSHQFSAPWAWIEIKTEFHSGNVYSNLDCIKKKLRDLSPQANYTDRATAANFFADRGCHVVSVTNPHGRILAFLDRSLYYLFQVVPQLYSEVEWTPFQTHYLFFL